MVLVCCSCYGTLYLLQQSVAKKENEAKRVEQTKQRQETPRREAPKQQEPKPEESKQQELTELEQIEKEQLMEWSSEGESDGTTRKESFALNSYVRELKCKFVNFSV